MLELTSVLGISSINTRQYVFLSTTLTNTYISVLPGENIVCDSHYTKCFILTTTLFSQEQPLPEETEA